MLENGANPNEKAVGGTTALHFAAECGYVEVVKELLKYNAIFCQNDVGMTPIKAAAERTRCGVVEYLLERPEITLEDKIEGLELLGASYANDKESYDIIRAYRYIMMSMELRYVIL